MTYPRTESFRDDYDPNVHPALVHALHEIATWHSARKANELLKAGPWPFPASPIPPDKTPPPRSPDAEPAPW